MAGRTRRHRRPGPDRRARRQLGKQIEILPYDAQACAAPSPAGQLIVSGEPLRTACSPAQLDPVNAKYVIATLDRACDGCLSGEFAAMVTAPVNKSCHQ